MIKSTGIIRKIDEFGRVVIPFDAREIFNIKKEDNIEILIDEKNEYIILKKAKNTCIKCNAEKHLIEIKQGFYLCNSCIDKLK